MAKTPGESAPSRDALTDAQRRVLSVFNGEPLTPFNVSMTLTTSVWTVRQHLKALVAANHLETTRRGRVIYYHAHGVEVPEMEADENQLTDDALLSDIPEDIQEDPQEREPRHSNDDAYLGAASPEDAIPKFDEVAIHAAELKRLYKETPAYMLPVVVQAMEEMRPLVGDLPALDVVYARYKKSDGIEKETLVHWFQAAQNNGLEPASLLEPHKKKTKADAPISRAINVGIETPAEVEETDRREHAKPVKQNVTVQRTKIQKTLSTYAPSPAASFQRPKKPDSDEKRRAASIRIDPRLTVANQMERDVFAKSANDLSWRETCLAGALEDVRGRLSDNEWKEYVMIVGLSEHGMPAESAIQRFTALFRKVHPAIPAAKAWELARLTLIPPSLRKKEDDTAYDVLASEYLHTY